MLSPALKDEVGAELAVVWLGDHVEPDVLWQDFGHACHNLFLFPTELLEVDDVGFHEHCATVAEDRQAFRFKGNIGEFLYRVAKLGSGALEEVTVAGRALGIELEVFDLAVV